MRKAARTDSNHKEIVAVFKTLGCSVRQTFQLPDGGGDIIVGLYGFNVLVEIKDGDKPPHKRKLTPDEEKFQSEWKGKYAVIENEDQAIALVAELAMWAKKLDKYGWKWK